LKHPALLSKQYVVDTQISVLRLCFLSVLRLCEITLRWVNGPSLVVAQFHTDVTLTKNTDVTQKFSFIFDFHQQLG